MLLTESSGIAAASGADRRSCSPLSAIVIASPAGPLLLARQVDRGDLAHLDRAALDEVGHRGLGRSLDLGAVEIDVQHRAVILGGPGRGLADAVGALRH